MGDFERNVPLTMSKQRRGDREIKKEEGNLKKRDKCERGFFFGFFLLVRTKMKTCKKE